MEVCLAGEVELALSGETAWRSSFLDFLLPGEALAAALEALLLGEAETALASATSSSTLDLSGEASSSFLDFLAEGDGLAFCRDV